MAGKDWRDLEELTANIQRGLAPDAEVIHDAKVMGHLSETERQVDVLVRQQIGQYQMVIAIDCKDYKHPVDVKGVEEFKGLVDDIGAHKGVLVCPAGFSGTAKKRAKGWGIELYRPVHTGDHKWKVRPFVPVCCHVFDCDFGIRISVTGPYGFTMEASPARLDVFTSSAIQLPSPIEQAVENWAAGEYEPKAGEREEPIYAVETYANNGCGMIVPADFAVRLWIRERVYYGQLPIDHVSGFMDDQTGKVITNAFTTGLLDIVKLQNQWKLLQPGEEPELPPFLRLTALQSPVL
ncbi:restriction endonuclease [Achromobacter ruhlandii]|uniref:restriction endonuclease n=1 Tax=Achromobacter ruhlandii TaxID=72557 RepID=UPI001EEE256F|nr:restriction endonuclease [Achromobacter ruhlandii]